MCSYKEFRKHLALERNTRRDLRGEDEEQMAEIKDENEQMYEESATNVPEISVPPWVSFEGRLVPRWVSRQGSINVIITDNPVQRVLYQINKRLVKYSDFLGERWEHIYVKTVSMDDHKPILVSIGSNNWDKIKPDVMEVHKLKYLEDYVERSDSTLEELVQTYLQGFKQIVYMGGEFEGWKDRDDAFVEMCFLDGCFIIQLFINNNIIINTTSRDNDRDVANASMSTINDPLFKSERVLDALRRDLIRPNNQLPFEVLATLYKHIKPPRTSNIADDHHDYESIISLAFEFLGGIVPNWELRFRTPHAENTKTNLLGIVYDGLNWPNMPSANYDNPRNIDGDGKWKMAKSATELEEFGVEFEMTKGDNFIDIPFTNKGVLKIPRICIGYGTPYSIKVLLAYEQSHCQHRYLNNYLWFMNSLVKSPSDVQLLRQKEIIDNLSELPDDAAIHKFLKDLYPSLMISHVDFNYVKVCVDLNLHCKNRRNSWMAKLKRDYFNSPWAFISFFAASLLLIFTVVQTVFSITSYYKRG